MAKIGKNNLIVFSFLQIFLLSTVKNFIGPLIPTISENYDIGLDSIGFMLSMSMVGVLVMSFITGSLIEVVGLRKTIITGCFLSFVGTILLIFNNTYFSFSIAYIILQIGVAISLVTVLSIAANSPQKSNASITLKLVLGNTLGFAFAPLCVGILLLSNLTWRYFFVFSLFPQLVLLVVLARKRFPEREKEIPCLIELLRIYKILLGNINFIICGIMIFFHEAVMYTFYSWFTLYFSGLHIRSSTSSFFLVFYSIAIIIGMLLKNKLVSRNSEIKILTVCIIVSFLLFVGVLLFNNVIVKVVLIFFFGLFMGGNFSLTFSTGSKLFPTYSNTASGILAAFSNLGVIVFQYLIGYLSEYFSKNSVLYVNVSILFILCSLVIVMNKLWKEFRVGQLG